MQMELLERKYVRELANQHNIRLLAAALNNTSPQLLLDLDDELSELTKDLSEEEVKKFDLIYCQEMDALTAMKEVEIAKDKLKIAELEAKTAEVELNQAQEQSEINIISYVVDFAIIFFVGLFIFGK
jgi:hypothetical protein